MYYLKLTRVEMSTIYDALSCYNMDMEKIHGKPNETATTLMAWIELVYPTLFETPD